MYLHEKLGVFYDEDNSTRQNFKADIIQDLQEETFSNFAHLGIYIYKSFRHRSLMNYSNLIVK